MIPSGIFNDAVEFSSVQMCLMYPISQMEDENAALFLHKHFESNDRRDDFKKICIHIECK